MTTEIAMQHYEAAMDAYEVSGPCPQADFQLKAAQVAALLADLEERDRLKRWLSATVQNLQAQGMLHGVPPMPGDVGVRK